MVDFKENKMNSITVSIQVSFMAIPYYSKSSEKKVERMGHGGHTLDDSFRSDVRRQETSLTLALEFLCAVGMREGYFAELGIEPSAIVVSGEERDDLFNDKARIVG